MTDPKTDDSDAVIALDEDTMQVLAAHRVRQRAERQTADAVWPTTGLMFTEQDGQPLHPAKVTERFKELVVQAGLPPIRLHDLRHGAATLALATGVEMKVVQAMLRHSSITITSDTYTSVLPQVAREAADATARMVPRRVASCRVDDRLTLGLPSGRMRPLWTVRVN